MNKNLNRTLLAVAISGILSSNVSAAISDIIITEYVEGSGDNKAIELTNTSDVAYTFADTDTLTYSSYKNDIFSPAKVNILTGVTIAANETIVFANVDSDDTLKAAITANGSRMIEAHGYESGFYNSMVFNGDDHVALRSNGDIVDNIGVDSDWGADKTFRRRLAEGDTTPAQSTSYKASEWEEFSKDAFDDLGTPTYSAFVAVAASTCTLDAQTTIAEIQGSGTSSPLITSGFTTTESYNITGIVTAVATYPAKGFYLQDATADGDVLTSDGIFVSTANATDDMVGNTVCLTSTITESFGSTQLETDSWDIIDTESTAPDATDIAMIAADNGSFSAMLERYEGMLVNLPADIDSNTTGNQDMRVTKTFGFNFDSFRNDIILSYQRPNMNPTQDNVAGSEGATALVAENNDFRLIVESSSKADNGEIPYYTSFNADPAANYIRINDSIIGMEGVITYSYSKFNIVPTKELFSSNFTHNSDRTEAPDLITTTEDGQFAIKIGTKNVLNLFNSPFGGDSNSHGDNRGADSDAEYQKQLAKIASAITGLNADIVGLMEIENNGFGDGSAIKELVDTVNEEYYDEDPKDKANANSTSNRYVFVGYDSNGDLILDELDSIGSDAITTGLLYRPSKVSITSMKKISMPAQHAPVIVNDNNVVVKDSAGDPLESGDNYQRETIAATFKINNTGKSLTIAVNHLKSKGSTCWEEWDGVEFGDESTWSDDAPDEDLQGSCENLRVAAAVQLGTELDKIGGDRVLVGDFNAYGKEDPILVLTENTTGKTITTARDTFIGDKPQFTVAGTAQAVTKTYGYINTIALKDAEKGKLSWSYSFNDEIGSLDHILISESLSDRLIDAVDWHINAAESSLYDYNEEFKGDDSENFYADDAYRSSDHDSAIMSLSYEYAEADAGEVVYLAISSSAVTVPYVLPTGALAGDVAQISLSSTSDMSDIVLPNITLTEDDQSLVDIEVYGIEAGTYTAKITLTRNQEVMSEFTKSMTFQAAKQDSTTAKITPAEEYDGSGGGGSFGVFSLLSLLGLGFLRRYKA